MSLATTNAMPVGMMPRAQNVAESIAMSIQDLWWMAERVAETGMFPGLKTPGHVFTMMAICQSEGLHPIEALRRYDVIEGKPAMKAAAIQAEFLKRGGRIKIIRRDSIEARAIFTHAQLCPDGWENWVSMEDLDKRGIIRGKDGIKTNYKRSPAEMLWARLVSNSIRTIDPGIVVGIPSTEEARDEIDVAFETAPRLPIGSSETTVTAADGRPLVVAEAQLPGQSAPGVDSRTFIDATKAAVEATNTDLREVVRECGGEVPNGVVTEIDLGETNRYMVNWVIQNGLHEGATPANNTEKAKLLAKVYKSHRDQMRVALKGFLDTRFNEIEARLTEPTPAPVQQPAPVADVPAELVNAAAPVAKVEPKADRNPEPESDVPAPPEQKKRNPVKPKEPELFDEPRGEGPDD